MRKQILRTVLLAVMGMGFLSLFLLFSKPAAATNPNLISFQGKVVNSDGTNVTNGTYSFNFVLFDDPTLGSESDGVHDKWHELNKSVDVTNGVFQTELGSATVLPDFSQYGALYLGVKFNGDSAGYMTPRIHLDSVPYAKYSDNAGALSGISGSNYVQLGTGNLQADASNNNSIYINKTSGTGNILELQKSSSDVFLIDNSGAVTITNTGTSAFKVQGAASVLSVDTTNSLTNVQGINSVATLGSELAASPTCSGVGWSGSGAGPYTHTQGNINPLDCTSLPVTSGNYYQIVMTTSSVTAGWISAVAATVTASVVYDNQTNIIGVAKVLTGGDVIFAPSTDFDGTVTIVSVKQINPANTVVSVNNSDGSSGIEIRAGGSNLDNTYIGIGSGATNTTGLGNTSVGSFALNSITTGNQNSAFGEDSLFINSTGSNNSAFGDNSLGANVSGNSNSSFGNQALSNNSTGSYNNAVGDSALYSNTSGDSNTAIGGAALYNNTSGNSNIGLGIDAGYNNQTGTSNIFIGDESGNCDNKDFCTLNNLQGAIAIGSLSQVQQSNSLILGGQGSNAVKIGIGTTSPTNLFSVSPDIYDTGTASVTSGTTAVTESGATWSSDYAGMEIIFADGTKYTIASATSSTITLSSNATVTETNSTYRIHNPAFYVSSTGATGIRTSTNSSKAFQVQDASGLTLFNVDTAAGYVASVSTSSNPFSIEQDGTNGRALYVVNTNITSTGYAELIEQDGNGTALQIQNLGSGLAFDVTNSSNKEVVSISSSNLILGQAGASGLDGTLTFNNHVGSNTVNLSLQADPGSSYTLLLPTTGPSTSQCLQTDGTTANQLKFAACATGGSGVTSVSYSTTANSNGGSVSGSVLTLAKADGSNPGLLSADAQTIGGTKTFNGGSILQTPLIPLYQGGADGTGAANSGTGSMAPLQVAVSGHYIYEVNIATGGTCSSSIATGCELAVYDASVPGSPKYIGGADASGSANSGTDAVSENSIAISGRYAYIASSHSSGTCSATAGSAVGCELKIFDISNPSSPKYVGGADNSGTTNGSNGSSTDDFENVAVSGRYAYIAKTGDGTACTGTAGSAIGCEMQIYDISNPAKPTYVSGVDESGSTNSGTGSTSFNYIAISGQYAFAVTNGDAISTCSATAGSAGGCEMQDYNISDPTKPVYVGGADSSGTTNANNNNFPFTSIAISGRYAFVSKNGGGISCISTASSGHSCGLMDFDISNPAAPTYVGGASVDGSTNSGTSGGSNNVTVYGRYAFMSNPGNATACSQTAGSATGCELQIFDVSNAASPAYKAGLDDSGSATGTDGGGAFATVVAGRYAYAVLPAGATACSATAGSAQGCELQIYDISGADVTSVTASSLYAGSVQVQNAAQFNDAVAVTGGLTVGQSGQISGDLGVGGLVSLQPVSSLIAGQSGLIQSLTNASSTGGTVNGYSQTITVANTTSASTTNGINISLTDNTALGNTNKGMVITLNGSNTSQTQYGADISVNRGVGLKVATTGNSGSAISCGTTTGTYGFGLCATNSASGGSAIYAENTATSSCSSGGTLSCSGITGSTSGAGSGTFIQAGIKGLATSANNSGTAYTNIGVYGKASAGGVALMYGGFFSLDSAAGSTSGAALYATNSTVAANILDLQDNTTSVFTVGDGGVTIAKSNSTSGFQIQDSASSKAVLTVDTSGDQVLLGKAGASGLNGKLVFNNGTDSSTAAITFTGNSTASYTYQLPTGTVSSNSCLQSGTVSSGVVPLSFGSCGSGGTSLSVNGASVGSTANLQNTTGTNSTAGNTFTNTSGNVTLAIDSATGSLAGVVTATGTQTFGGSKVFSGTTLFSNTAQVQKTSTSSLQVQTDSGSTDLLTADTSNMHININSTFTALGTGFGTLSVTDAGAGSLTSGSQYYYVVTAIDSAGGETTASTEGTLGTGHTALTVSWTTITGASGYRIYRATTTGGETYYTTVFTNSFTDTGQYTAGTTTASGTNTARSATNNSSSALQLSIGGNGSPTGQLYVSGVVPSSFTGRTTDGLSGPNRIFVQGRYAYVASESNHSLVIYDVSNPAAPQKISSTASPFTDPQDVYVQGKYAYICDFTNNAIYIFDVSNPASPTQVGAATTGLSAPQSVYVQGHYAYVASSTNSTLAIFDVSNPASPVPASTITTNLSTPVRVYVQGNYAYVANQGTSTSAIFDVSNPASPSAAGTFNIGGGNANRYVVVQGRYAYSVGTNASNKGVFTINDVSNPGVGVSSPVVKTILGTDNNDFNQPVRISVQGRYAYIASRGDCSLVVFDISTPSSPNKVGSVSSGMVPGGAGCTVGGSDGPRGLFVLGRYAYLTANTANAFAIYDMGGTYTQQLEAGGAEVGSLQVDSNAQVAGDFSIQGGAAVGQSLQVTGSISSGSGGVTIASTGNTGSVTLSQASTTSNVSLVLPSSLPGASNYCIVSTNLGVLSFSACGAGSTRTVTLSPEYPGAVMTANNTTGNTHTGTMTSDFCSGSSHLGIPASNNPCGATEEHNYYSWTANATNDYDIFVRWQAPSDFSSLSSINFYGWKNGATDDVKLTIYSSTGSVCGTATSISGSTSTWINQAYTTTGCSPSAGNVLTFDLDLKVAVSSDITRVGEINIVYNRN